VSDFFNESCLRCRVIMTNKFIVDDDDDDDNDDDDNLINQYLH